MKANLIGFTRLQLAIDEHGDDYRIVGDRLWHLGTQPSLISRDRLSDSVAPTMPGRQPHSGTDTNDE